MSASASLQSNISGWEPVTAAPVVLTSTPAIVVAASQKKRVITNVRLVETAGAGATIDGWIHANGVANAAGNQIYSDLAIAANNAIVEGGGELSPALPVLNLGEELQLAAPTGAVTVWVTYLEDTRQAT